MFVEERIQAMNKSGPSFPPGFMEDQNKYLPQHKPGDPEGQHRARLIYT